MDLISGYLLIILILFSVNISLLFGNYNMNNLKLFFISSIISILTFILMNLFNFSLIEYLSYLFFAIALSVFIIMFYYLKYNNYKITLLLTVILCFISILLLSSQLNLDFFTESLYSLLMFIIIFSIYQLTKFLQYAKREYNVIVGEFMSLFSLLLFIFSLTYNSTRNLDYTMFNSFLILTPTFQLIYVIIIISVILVIGIFLNENRGENS